MRAARRAAMQDACTASEYAARKSTSVTCVTEVGLHRSLNPRTRWPISQYEWIKTSGIQPAAERKRALATDWKAL
eukprot:3098904-Pleurochrysis_carterae.AAC.1